MSGPEVQNPEGMLVVGGAERWANREVAKRVYTMGEQLRARAFEQIGLNEAGLHPYAKYTATITSPDRQLTAIITRDAQRDADTRSVVVTDRRAEGESFEAGRYLQPDGSMWQSADSSQGEPWYEVDLPSDLLYGMGSRLEELSQSNCWVNVEFSSYSQVAASEHVA